MKTNKCNKIVDCKKEKAKIYLKRDERWGIKNIGCLKKDRGYVMGFLFIAFWGMTWEIPLLSFSIKETNVCQRIYKYNSIMGLDLFGSKTNTKEKGWGAVRWPVLAYCNHTDLLTKKFLFSLHTCLDIEERKVKKIKC